MLVGFDRVIENLGKTALILVYLSKKASFRQEMRLFCRFGSVLLIEKTPNFFERNPDWGLD